MVDIESKLRAIEYRLQTLIEGSMHRLFPEEDAPINFAHECLEAMKNGVRVGENGGLIAPHLYILNIHHNLTEGIISNPQFIDDLTQYLQDAGSQAGFKFLSPLLVNYVETDQMSTTEIQVEAFHNLTRMTQTMEVNLSEINNIKNLSKNAFLIVDGTQVFSLNKTILNIGRRNDNHLVIHDPRVSRLHAQLRLIRNRFVIFDLESKGGTFVNNQRVQQHTLAPGDVISLAGASLIFGQENSDFGETQDISQILINENPTNNNPQ